MNMSYARLRSAFASIIGWRYRELPGMGGAVRQALDETLSDLQARKYKECGTPCYELNNEYYRIGKRTLKVSTEDEMEIGIWGSKELLEQVYGGVVRRLSNLPSGVGAAEQTE